MILLTTKYIIITFIVAFYIATHVICNIEHEDAELLPMRHEKDNPHKVVNYLIPGMLRVPRKALEPFANEMVGDVVFVDLNSKVWDSKHFAEQIVNDIREGGYKDVRIFAISIGDKVARQLDSEVGHELRKSGIKITTYDINPCANRGEVKGGFRLGLVLGAPLFRLITFALGPIGYLDIIPGDQGSVSDPNRHSLVEISSQLWAIAFEDTGKFKKSRDNIVLSRDDARLDNDKIVADAGGSARDGGLPGHIVMISGGHADVIGYKVSYLDALNDLGAFDDDYD